MREIVLDTETTGLDPASGDRIVEIGCVELINHLPTGNILHRYIDPERDIPEQAVKIHGLSREVLAEKKAKIFSEHVDEIIEFLGDSVLIIHNAEFDLKFLNWEFKLVKRPGIDKKRAIDTVALARKKFPGSPANLDALCRRFGIDNSNRKLHGALRDSDLLAKVYLQLIGGREPSLTFSSVVPDKKIQKNVLQEKRQPRIPRQHLPTANELIEHEKFVLGLKNPIWLRE